MIACNYERGVGFVRAFFCSYIIIGVWYVIYPIDDYQSMLPYNEHVQTFKVKEERSISDQMAIHEFYRDRPYEEAKSA